MMGAQHTPGQYVPLPWTDGGWTVGCPGGDGEMQAFPLTFYVSVKGEEGRVIAQERADWNNQIVAERDAQERAAIAKAEGRSDD